MDIQGQEIYNISWRHTSYPVLYKVLLILSVSTAVVSSTPNLRAITTNYLSLKRLYNNKSTISLQRPGYKIMIKSQLPDITSKA